MNEKKLIQGLKKQDIETLRFAWKKYYYISKSFVKNRPLTDELKKDIEDQLQSAFVILWQKLNKGEVITQSLEAMMYGILKNIWLKKWRRDKNDQNVYLKNNDQNGSLGDIEDQTDEVEQLEKLRYKYKIAKEVLTQMAEAGKKECVELIKDSFMSNMRDSEIAQEMKLSVDYIRQKRHRCMKSLHKAMKQHPLYKFLKEQLV